MDRVDARAAAVGAAIKLNAFRLLMGCRRELSGL
jgi:hypothetical protein